MHTIIEPTLFNALMEELRPATAFAERYQQDMTPREMLHLKTVALFEIGRITQLVEALDVASGLFMPMVEQPQEASFGLFGQETPIVPVALTDEGVANPQGIDGPKPAVADLKLP